MRPSEVLLACAGWTQKCAFRDTSGHPVKIGELGIPPVSQLQMCMLGAIRYAALSGGITHDQERAMTDLLEGGRHGPRMLPARWNDAPERKVSEVIAVLRGVERRVLR